MPNVATDADDDASSAGQPPDRRTGLMNGTVWGQRPTAASYNLFTDDSKRQSSWPCNASFARQ